LGGLFTGAENTYTAHQITPVLNSPDDIQRWQKHSLIKGQDKNKKLPAFLHFDTGMNRLGLSAKEFQALRDNSEMLEGIDVQTILSHFVAADDWAEGWALELTIAQADLFADIAVRFPQAKKSLANSSGLFRHNHYHYDMVRPGYALYGGYPTPETKNPMKPIIRLDARILQIRECRKGESIGYAASHKFKKDTRTATIALGYADGFLRSGSNKAVVYYNNQPCPVLGRVSMDLVTIDLSGIKGKQPVQGEAIEILGPHQTVDDLAKTAGTIGYEILTSLGTRYKRDYI
jgi:alanine racemase